MGDYIGEHSRLIKGDIGRLDYGSYRWSHPCSLPSLYIL